MRLIKRYPNRKLYDTAEKAYVTLDGIAELIRAGDEVQVIDHSSGEDLTAVTLTQIIFEQEKKHAGFLPRPVLTGLIQAGGDRLSTLRRRLASPLDLLRHVDDEIERRVRALIQRGDLDEQEGLRLRDSLLAVERDEDEGGPWPPREDPVEYVRKLLAASGVPSRDELHRLEGQLELLEEKLDRLLADSQSRSG
ncbi:MAG TPA: polyhydroxyalkanoate synthesis regulator DNA-binding domain-containing protein [Candidatus Sulfomarinibacteraceae bacterium]|nr:polyhydroxyalkanoate synthesis regulator DNA-binding domain-containing protein [Candidatus Sulfomarinibacteraceae bacterium]